MLNDYSNYVIAAYVAADLITGGLLLFVVTKYFAAKSKVKNAKSA